MKKVKFNYAGVHSNIGIKTPVEMMEEKQKAYNEMIKSCFSLIVKAIWKRIQTWNGCDKVIADQMMIPVPIGFNKDYLDDVKVEVSTLFIKYQWNVTFMRLAPAEGRSNIEHFVYRVKVSEEGLKELEEYQ